METRRFDTWSELKWFIDNVKMRDEFIWRGHSSSDWELSSSLFRFFESQGVQSEKRVALEEKSIVKFKTQYMRPEEEQAALRKRPITDLIILMQHYGCPTRMMDWTWSPYIATYFTLPDMNEFGAIYGLNLTKYQTFIAPQLPLDDYDHSVLDSLNDRLFNRFLDSKDFKYPVPFNPSYHSERAFKQQSIFLMDLELTSPTENILQGLSDDMLWKLEFPRVIREQIYQDLVQMNIDGYHLFSDLQGVALRAKEELVGVPSQEHTIKRITIDY